MAKKRRIPVKSFETVQDFQQFIHCEKDWMYSKIYEGIMEAFLSNLDSADVLEAKIEETMDLISIKSDREEWIYSLSLAIEWYESEEMYEKCADILNLIKKIQINL